MNLNILEKIRLNKEKDKKIKELIKERDILYFELAETKTRSLPEQVVCQTLERGIRWSDYKNLPMAERIVYCTGAQELVKNKVLNNEIDHFVDDLVKHIAKQSRNFEEVRDLRSKIVALEVLRERLKSINHRPKEETKNNLNSVI